MMKTLSILISSRFVIDRFSSFRAATLMQKSTRAFETIIQLFRSTRGTSIDAKSVPAPHLSRRSVAAHRVLRAPARDPLEHFFREHFSNEDTSIKIAAERLRPAFAAKRARALDQSRRLRSANRVANCMTVNVAVRDPVVALSQRVTRKDWHRFETKVEQNTNRLLKIFAESHVTGTFFVRGWIADRYPALVQRIASAGHEIASHGYWHHRVDELTPESFAKDVITSRDAIFNACGVVVTAYRAPRFSITSHSRWALEILTELGFRMDSSIIPASANRRHDAVSLTRVHHLDTGSGEIIEVPPTIGRTGRMSVALSSKSFRLMPLWMTRKAIKDFRSRVGPAMLCLEPWGMDAKLPRSLIRSKETQSRRPFAPSRCGNKLRKLLQSDRFDTMTNVVRTIMPECDYIPGVGCKAISDRSSSTIFVESSAMQTLSNYSVPAM